MCNFKLIFILSILLIVYTNSISALCRHFSSCECVSFTDLILNLNCPMQTSEITPRININYYFEVLYIKCNSTESVNKLIPDNLYEIDRIIKRNISKLIIKHCSFDKEQTLSELFKGNINTFKEIEINSNNIIKQNSNFLNGFENISVLSLTNIIISNLWNNLNKFNDLHFLEIHNGNIKTTNILNNLKLETFILEDDTLETIHPDTFSKIPNLKTVSISSRNFKELPNDLFKYNNFLSDITIVDVEKSMKFLDMDFIKSLTSLTHITICTGLHGLSSNFFDNHNMTISLNISRNNFNQLPKLLLNGLLYLYAIDLSHNQLKYLDDEFFIKNTKLARIDLSNNQFIRISNQQFNQLHQISKINLENNNLTQFNLDLSNFKHLHTLVLSGNNINQDSNEDNRCFLSRIPDHSLFVFFYIYLSNNHISNLNFVKCLFDLNRKVIRIDLQNNKISDLLFADISVRPKAALHLDLSNNKISNIDFWSNLRTSLPSSEILDDNYSNSDNYSYIWNDESKFHIQIDDNPFLCNNCSFLIDDDNLKKLNKITYIDTIALTMVAQKLDCIKKEQCSLDVYNENIKCPDECKCDVQQDIKTLLIDCSSQNLTFLPDFEDIGKYNNEYIKYIDINVKNNKISDIVLYLDEDSSKKLRSLNAENNNIRYIYFSNFPENIEQLFLANNSIKRMPNNIIENLNKRGLKLSVTLANNYYYCDDELNIQDQLTSVQFSILDRDEIKCFKKKSYNAYIAPILICLLLAIVFGPLIIYYLRKKNIFFFRPRVTNTESVTENLTENQIST